MLVCAVLLALPFFHSAIAALLLGGLLGGGGVESGETSALTVDGDAKQVLAIVTKLENSITSALHTVRGTNVDTLGGLDPLDVFSDLTGTLDDATRDLAFFGGPVTASRIEYIPADLSKGVADTMGNVADDFDVLLGASDVREEEAIKLVAMRLARVIESIEELDAAVPGLSEVDYYLGSIYQTVDDKISDILEMAEQVVPSTLDRVVEYLGSVGAVIDPSFVRVQRLFAD